MSYQIKAADNFGVVTVYEYGCDSLPRTVGRARGLHLIWIDQMGELARDRKVTTRRGTVEIVELESK